MVTVAMGARKRKRCRSRATGGAKRETSARMPGDRTQQPRVAYVAGTYPELSQTFVTGELAELGRRGVETVVFAVVRGRGPLQGAPPATYVVELRKPAQVASLVALAGPAPDPHGACPARPAAALGRLGARHGGAGADGPRHARRSTTCTPTSPASPPTWPRGCRELTGVPFSFTAHAHDVFVEWERMHEKLARRASRPPSASTTATTSRSACPARAGSGDLRGRHARSSIAAAPTTLADRSWPWGGWWSRRDSSTSCAPRRALAGRFPRC